MRSGLVVRASDCQCTSCNGPGFDPSIRRHSGIWGAADEAVLDIVRTKRKKSPKKIFKKKSFFEILSAIYSLRIIAALVFREVLSADIVHVRRPTMQGLDAWLHVNPQGEEKVSIWEFQSSVRVHCDQFRPVLRIRTRIRIHRIHMFLGLPDPDPLIRGMDPDPESDPSIIMRK